MLDPCGFLAYRAHDRHGTNPTAREDSKLPYRWISGRARNWARGPTERYEGSRLFFAFSLSLRSRCDLLSRRMTLRVHDVRAGRICVCTVLHMCMYTLVYVYGAIAQRWLDVYVRAYTEPSKSEHADFTVHTCNPDDLALAWP